MDILNHLGESLKTYRQHEMLKQHEMAKLCCVSERYYRKLEAGRTNPSYLILATMRVNLGLDLNRMVDACVTD